MLRLPSAMMCRKHMPVCMCLFSHAQKGQCVRLCPQGNIRLENGRAVIGTDCVQCLGCLQYCPTAAISLGSITDRREHYHNPNISAEELAKTLIHID